MQALNLHSDFRDESFRVANISDYLRRWISFFVKVSEFNWNAFFYLFLIFPAAIVGLLLSLPVLLALWLGFKWSNKGLQVALNMDLKDSILDSISYIDAKERLVQITNSLDRIEKLDVLVSDKTVLFKPLFKKEIQDSKNIINKYIVEKQRALSVLDKPLLKDFDMYIVKEADLWEKRNAAYDYVL